jgi:hypothetical protein
MPGNWGYLTNDMREYVTNTYPKDWSVLDIGCGHGHYAKLLKHHFSVKNFDGIEVWEPYIQEYNLNNLYTNIYNVNILNFNFNYYDLIIMGDVLEHLSRDDGVNLINKLASKCTELLVIVPYYLPQDIVNDNVYEVHLQPDLDDDIMSQYYPSLELINYNNKNFKIKIDVGDKTYYYCAFRKKK